MNIDVNFFFQVLQQLKVFAQSENGFYNDEFKNYIKNYTKFQANMYENCRSHLEDYLTKNFERIIRFVKECSDVKVRVFESAKLIRALKDRFHKLQDYLSNMSHLAFYQYKTGRNKTHEISYNLKIKELENFYLDLIAQVCSKKKIGIQIIGVLQC